VGALAAGERVPGVRHAEGDGPPVRQLAMLQWGLIPSWAADPRIGFRCINARAETVATKPAFRAAFRKRRCLIPTTGFYEWQKKGKGKQPFLFRMRDRQPFAFAALWDRWAKGDGREMCAILTTKANDLVRPLHDRMPVILPLAFHDDWLEPPQDAAEWLQAALRPYPAQEMEAVPVSTWVNNARHEGPKCIQPLD
jgi:putative SOS response-associated peptidase YedK